LYGMDWIGMALFTPALTIALGMSSGRSP
jgi:hypothetical protein